MFFPKCIPQNASPAGVSRYCVKKIIVGLRSNISGKNEVQQQQPKKTHQISLMLGFFNMLVCIEYTKSLSGMVCFLNLFALPRK